MWTRGESVVVTVLQNIQYSLLKQERVLAIIRTSTVREACSQAVVGSPILVPHA